MVLTLHKIRNLTFGQTKSGQQILNMCVLNMRQQNWIQMHNFQPQNANKLQLLVETPSKFLITNDHLFWKESNMSLDDSTNILYMLKSPIIFSFLYPNAHVKLYFPVDHPWPRGLRTFNDLCKQWRKLNTAKKASAGQVFQCSYTTTTTTNVLLTCIDSYRLYPCNLFSLWV